MVSSGDAIEFDTGGRCGGYLQSEFGLSAQKPSNAVLEDGFVEITYEDGHLLMMECFD